jgi:hypothetical protein
VHRKMGKFKMVRTGTIFLVVENESAGKLMAAASYDKLTTTKIGSMIEGNGIVSHLHGF